MKTKKKKGFTLTELIVVIVIIGVLAAVMIPTLTGYITKAQNSKDETLVSSLNRTYENTKIMDDIEIYTAYDVQAFLKEVDMENIEVANKSNLILFDTIEDKFVLVKENERNDAFYKEDNEGNLVLNNSGEFVINPSEYYKINHSFYEDTNALAVVNLEYSKLSHEHSCKGTHRAFIVSTNGPEEAVAVATFMKINGSMETNTLNGNKYLKNEMIEIFTKSYSDSNFKEKLLNALSKTLFIDNVNGTNIYFYVDTNNNYKITNLPSSSAENQPALTRPTILPDVKEVDLSVISGLSQCTTIVPGTVECVKTSNMGNTNEVSGNTEALDNPSIAIELDTALLMPIAKELLSTISEKVYNETQLNEILECYDSNTLINKIKVQLNLSDSDEIIIQLKNKLNNLSKTITIMGSFTIESSSEETKTITIPEGVYLYIPYDNSNIDIKDYIEYKNNINNASKVKGMTIPDSVNKNGDSNEFSKINKLNGEEDRTDNLKKELVIGKNVTLEVNGTIIVSGVTGVKYKQGLAGHTSGDYAQIKLETETSIINLGATGILDVYGYVIGNGKINTVSGATINEPFVIGDFAGGSNSAILAGSIPGILIKDFNSNGQTTPFGEYGLVNIQTDINIVYGATLGGFVKIFFDDTWNNNNNMPLSLLSSKSGSFIKMNEGSTISLSYSNDNIISEDRKSFSNVGKTKIDINGSIETGSISISLFVKITDIDLSSDDFLLPIPFTFDINFLSGSSTIKNKLALLPGSKMTVSEESTLTIYKSSQLFIFDKLGETNSDGSASFSITSFPYPKDLSASEFIVNGTLNINGTFGGIVQTTSQSAVINTSKDAVLDGSTQAKFGSLTKEIKVEVGSLSMALTFQENHIVHNYKLKGMIVCNKTLIQMEKKKQYIGFYNSQNNVSYDNVVDYYIASNQTSGETKVVWSLDSTARQVNSSNLIKGEWNKKNIYTVTLEFEGFTSSSEINIVEGNSITVNDIPMKAGKTAKLYLKRDWNLVKGYTYSNEYNYSDITSDMTIYVKYE